MPCSNPTRMGRWRKAGGLKHQKWPNHKYIRNENPHAICDISSQNLNIFSFCPVCMFFFPRIFLCRCTFPGQVSSAFLWMTIIVMTVWLIEQLMCLCCTSRSIKRKNLLQQYPTRSTAGLGARLLRRGLLVAKVGFGSGMRFEVGECRNKGTEGFQSTRFYLLFSRHLEESWTFTDSLLSEEQEWPKWQNRSKGCWLPNFGVKSFDFICIIKIMIMKLINNN